MQDMINRLRLDPGTRTLGQLLQEREWAVNEFARLRGEKPQRLSASTASRLNDGQPSRPVLPLKLPDPALSAHRLLRMPELCLLLGLSRAAIYKLRAAGRFPAPMKLGLKSVRWRLADVLVWQAECG